MRVLHNKHQGILSPLLRCYQKKKTIVKSFLFVDEKTTKKEESPP